MQLPRVHAPEKILSPLLKFYDLGRGAAICYAVFRRVLLGALQDDVCLYIFMSWCVPAPQCTYLIL